LDEFGLRCPSVEKFDHHVFSSRQRNPEIVGGAPEICVEILSPSNTAREIDEKIALYFEAGACEVWICERDGTLKFHFSSPPEIRESSELCPQFPPLISFLKTNLGL
jgi:Uma2 family endonuclease